MSANISREAQSHGGYSGTLLILEAGVVEGDGRDCVEGAQLLQIDNCKFPGGDARAPDWE